MSRLISRAFQLVFDFGLDDDVLAARAVSEGGAERFDSIDKIV